MTMTLTPATQTLLQSTVARTLRELQCVDATTEEAMVLADLASSKTTAEVAELLRALTSVELTTVFTNAKARLGALERIARCDAELDALGASRSQRYVDVQTAADKLSRVLRGASSAEAYATVFFECDLVLRATK